MVNGPGSVIFAAWSVLRAQEFHVPQLDRTVAADVADHAGDLGRLARSRGDDGRMFGVDPLQRRCEVIGVALPPDLAIGHDIDTGALHAWMGNDGRIILRVFQMIVRNAPQLRHSGARNGFRQHLRGPPASRVADSFPRPSSAAHVSAAPMLQLPLSTGRRFRPADHSTECTGEGAQV